MGKTKHFKHAKRRASSSWSARCPASPAPPTPKFGAKTVLMAATGINLALGLLYAWSIIGGAIPEAWGWSSSERALPYCVACITFALAMIPGGRLQDIIGPRWVATLGGILAGGGCIIAGLSGASLVGFVIGFGVLAGMGIGFGYAAATPPVVKWFPPHSTGLVAGIVVAGFGLASVYIAPLATWLLGVFAKGPTVKGVSETLIILGCLFLVAVVGLAQFLRNPPKACVIPGKSPKKAHVSNRKITPAPSVPNIPCECDENLTRQYSPLEAIRDPKFIQMWFLYFAGASAGLTFISVAQQLGKQAMGELAFLAVVVLALGNAAGRVLAGVASDKLGREPTLIGCFLFQAAALVALQLVGGLAAWPILLVLLFCIGANYGANLSIFPAACKDMYGIRHFGMNYGVLFSAWGLAGLVMPWLNGRLTDATGSGAWTTIIIVALLLMGAALTMLMRHNLKPKSSAQAQPTQLPLLAKGGLASLPK